MVYLKIAVSTGRKSGGQPVSQVRLVSVCVCVCVYVCVCVRGEREEKRGLHLHGVFEDSCVHRSQKWGPACITSEARISVYLCLCGGSLWGGGRGLLLSSLLL